MNDLPPNFSPTPATDDPLRPLSDRNETRNWLMVLHLSPLLGIWIGGVGSILAPLIIWLIKKDHSAEIDAHGKLALNFQLSLAIYFIISGILMFFLIGFLILPIVGILWLYGMIKAAVDVNQGAPVKYPFAIPFLK